MDSADRNAAKPEKNGGKYVVSVGGIKVIPSEEKQKNLAVKGVQPQDITLGAQPSHITLGSGEKTLTAKVDASEMIGNEV